PMSKVFFGSSGSDANDTQAKLVWFYNNALGRPEKKKLVSRKRGYHGVTVLSAGLTGLANLHQGFDLPLPMIRHARAPHRLWEATQGMTDDEFVRFLADDLEQLILREGPETVAAFIAEPLQAAGGVLVPPPGYFPAIQEVLRRHDVLLIADEVVCGFGRLGCWFGSELFGIEPDLITVAKGLTSAYIPLSGCLVSERVWSVVADASKGVFGHGYTYTAHPVAAAAAMENLDIIERDGLVAQAAARGARLNERLHDAFDDLPLPHSPVRPVAAGRGARRATLPRTRRDHPCAARRRHDRVLAAVRRHGGRARRDGLDGARGDRRRGGRAACRVRTSCRAGARADR